MGDSWEDEDEDSVAIKLPVPAVVAPESWEEEEDETLVEQAAAAKAAAARLTRTPAQIEAQRKKELEEEEKLQNQLKFAQLANETLEERVVRERQQVEKADAALTEELFDAVPTAAKRSASSGIAGLVLKTKEDHVNFGITASSKMSTSTSFCVTAFLKEVLTRNGNTLSAESLVELGTIIQVCYFVGSQAFVLQHALEITANQETSRRPCKKRSSEVE
jgi:hypothetical protein